MREVVELKDIGVSRTIGDYIRVSLVALPINILCMCLDPIQIARSLQDVFHCEYQRKELIIHSIKRFICHRDIAELMKEIENV